LRKWSLIAAFWSVFGNFSGSEHETVTENDLAWAATKEQLVT
jgi:hypothetical protein